MRIEFDPTNPDEAAAVRAMLTAMHHPVPEVKFNGDGSFSVGYMRDPSTEGPNVTGANIGVAEVATLRLHESDDIPTEASERVESLTRMGSQVTDSDGTPWDARIHSTPPTTNKDGTWRAKRGVKAEEIAAVKAEREMAEVIESAGFDGHAPAPAQEQSAPPAPNAPVGEQSAPPAPPAPTGQSEAPLAPAATPTVPADTAPTTQSAPAAPTSPSFLDVMKAITAAQKDGKIDTAKVKELCAAVGAGESTMGLNGPDNGDKRVAFMALLAAETEGK